jgi:hypothetical protein
MPAPEPPEVGYYHKSDNAKYDGFRLLLQTAGREDQVVKKMGCH